MATKAIESLFCEATLYLLKTASPIRKITLARLPFHHFGFSCSVPANFVAERDELPANKRPLTLFATCREPANSTLYQLWKRSLPVLPFIEKLIDHAKAKPRYQDLLHTWRAEPYFDTSGAAARAKPPVSFTQAEIATAQKQLIAIGIDPKRPWVCLCIREDGYLQERLGQSVSDANQYRQSSIERFDPAVRYLLNQGLQVVKMGVSTRQRLTSAENAPGYIDYSQGERSAFLDIYLVSACRLYLGDSDGLVNVARLFHRPVVVANWIPVSLANTARANCLLLFKRLRDLRTGKVLSFAQLRLNGLDELLDTADYATHQLEPLENDAEDILEATRFMVERNFACPETNLAETLATLRFREPLRAMVSPAFVQKHRNLFTDYNKNILTAIATEQLGRAISLAKQLDRPEAKEPWLTRIASIACSWNTLPKTRAQTIVPTRDVPLCYLPHHDWNYAELQGAGQRALAQQIPIANARSRQISSSKPRKSGPIRIAYLSHDFRSHSAGVPLWPIMNRHTPDRFSVFALTIGDRPDFSSTVKCIDFSRLDSQEQIRITRELDIDLLVNATDHLPHSPVELLLAKPARTTIAAWGYLPILDSRINDAFLTDDTVFRELATPPDMIRSTIPVYHLQAPDLSGFPKAAEVAPVIAAFNNTYKLNDALFATWLNILKQAPGSTLLMPQTNRYAMKRLKRRTRKSGISIDRVRFVERMERKDHLQRLASCSLALDNPFMGSGGQLFDALESGIPAITLLTSLPCHRSGESILRAINLEQYIADDLAQYEEMALEILTLPTSAQSAKKRFREAYNDYRSTGFAQAFEAYETQLQTLVGR